jgi:hypothetical protein
MPIKPKARGLMLQSGNDKNPEILPSCESCQKWAPSHPPPSSCPALLQIFLKGAAVTSFDRIHRISEFQDFSEG